MGICYVWVAAVGKEGHQVAQLYSGHLDFPQVTFEDNLAVVTYTFSRVPA